MKFLHAVGPIAISIAVWPQLIAENERKIWHIVPSLWQTTVTYALKYRKSAASCTFLLESLQESLYVWGIFS